MSKLSPEPSSPRSSILRPVETALYKEWERRRIVHCRREAIAPRRRRPGSVRHSDAAAQCDGGSAHGARSQQHRAGRRHSLAAHVRRRSALAAGTDHAGIATQNVIEKQLAAEGKTRFDLGREAFVARTTDFVTETGGTILEQLRAIGASCDWTRTAYTLSPELSQAVREAFVLLTSEDSSIAVIASFTGARAASRH